MKSTDQVYAAGQARSQGLPKVERRDIARPRATSAAAVLSDAGLRRTVAAYLLALVEVAAPMEGFLR